MRDEEHVVKGMLKMTIKGKRQSEDLREGVRMELRMT